MKRINHYYRTSSIPHEIIGNQDIEFIASIKHVVDLYTIYSDNA